MAVVRVFNGVEYVEHSKTPIDVAATVSHNGKELKFKGPCSVVEMRNSWKYGHELHITVHCSPLNVEQKKANGTPWSRIEIAIPYYLGVQWLQKGLDSLYEGSGKLVTGETNIGELI